VFSVSARRLAGVAAILLGWRPHEFWPATPAEVADILNAMAGAEATPIAPGDLQRLTEMFPDG
jgi:hypothetical protein